MKTEPETEPTSASRAFRFRWWLLVAATLCLIAGLSWFAAPLLTTELSDAGQLVPTTLLPTAAFLGFEAPETKLDYALGLTTFLGVLLLTQWMFLRPRRGWALQLNRESRPLKIAAVAAALMAMMLTVVGAMATVGEVASGDWLDRPDNSGIFLGTTGLWAVWTLVFYIHSRRLDRVTELQRTTRALIAGSVLELFVTRRYTESPMRKMLP